MHVLKSNIVAHPHFDQRLFHTGGIKVKLHKLLQNHVISLLVCTAVLCSHKKTFSEWCSVTMQHETLCRTPLALGILKRVHHSIPVTNHLPHSGGWRAASTAESPLRYISSINACLDATRWKFQRLSSCIISVYFSLFFLFLRFSSHYQLRWKRTWHQSI